MGEGTPARRPARSPQPEVPAAIVGWALVAFGSLVAVGSAVAVGSLVRANVRLRRERADLRARAAQAGEAASMISHDLAQPLASAASLAELLAVDWPGLAEQDRRELAVNIDRAVQRLIAAVNEHLPRLRQAVQASEPAEPEVTGRR